MFLYKETWFFAGVVKITVYGEDSLNGYRGDLELENYPKPNDAANHQLNSIDSIRMSGENHVNELVLEGNGIEV